tara:strand:- start:319 stop:489 length:171 start_codon:yes stop_codon:yes gene_type:complete
VRELAQAKHHVFAALAARLSAPMLLSMQQASNAATGHHIEHAPCGASPCKRSIAAA